MSHYYTKSGEPCYTVIGKNGNERPTTVADARKLHLVPSVSTILNVSAKPGLINWMLDQAILAALTLPKKDDETEQEYLDRVKSDSKQQGIDAADEGTKIHQMIEDYMNGYQLPEEYDIYGQSVEASLELNFGKQPWVSEFSFAHPLGFGGKVDLHCERFVVDIKTKEFGPDDKVIGYEEHCMQLAAYREGLGLIKARCANLFVSRTVPGLVRVYEWNEKELSKGLDCFVHLFNYWKARNNYDPNNTNS